MSNLPTFLQSLSQNCLYRKILGLSCNTYAIKALRLQTITPDQLRLHLQKTNKAHFRMHSRGLINHQSAYAQSWNSNEFRIFAWISVCYSHVHSKSFTGFNNQDFKFLAEVFPHKSRDFLEYNLKVLSKDEYCHKRSKWTHKEITLFTQIMKQQNGECKWTQISLQLFIRSDKQFFQTPQKCREQWINHLNPDVCKDKWSLDEDILLFRSVLKEGKKWSQVSKFFNGSRTEHMVKNRYKSMLNKQQAKHKKVSQKKLCQNILFSLQCRLDTMQTQKASCSMLLEELPEIVLESGVSSAKTQPSFESRGETKNNFIEQIYQITGDVFSQQQKTGEGYQIHNWCETTEDNAKMQLRQFDFEWEGRGKSEQDIYIESLLY